MPGIFGGTHTGTALRDLGEPLDEPSRFETDVFEAGPYGLGLVHHGDRDPGGHATWTDGRRAGVRYGAVTNLHRLPFGDDELFERVLEDPTGTLAQLDGPFALACYDADEDRFVLATDKLGTRPLHYDAADGLTVASRVKAVLTRHDDPVVDGQSVSDMILMGSVWGDRTLVDGIRALQPRTVLVYDDGTVDRREYWSLSFDEAEPGPQYGFELASRYRSAVEDMAHTLDGDVGLWLSGGLDSRTMAGELKRLLDDGAAFDLDTYTYDANPQGPNPAVARRIANALELPNKRVPLDAGRAVEYIQSAVDATDGMSRWNSFINISAIYNVSGEPDVMLEAAGQGELLGEHVNRYQLRRPSAVDGIYAGQAAVPVERVTDILDADVDPLESFKRTVRESDERTTRAQVLDAHFTNHYSRFVYSSNPLARTRVGTRIPFANGDFLSHVAKLPMSDRMGTVPFTDGNVPYGASKPKLGLVRSLQSGLADIPYERTRMPPKYPYRAHVAGFLLGSAHDKLLSDTGHAGESMTGKWYRDDGDLRAYVDGLVEDACDRPFFDGDAVMEARAEHLAGEADNVGLLAPITTVELWLQLHMDGGATLSEPSSAGRPSTTTPGR